MRYNMLKYRKYPILLIHFVLILFLPNVTMGVTSLILKLTLVTVQGPTEMSQLIQLTTYYAAISIFSYLMIRRLTQKNPSISTLELVMIIVILFIIESLLNYFGNISMFLPLTSGTISTASYLYAFDVSYIISVRNIPKIYFLKSDFLEFLIMIVFSLVGIYFARKTNKFNLKSKELSPY